MSTKNKRILPMTDKVYDFLIHLVKYILPGLGTLYFTIAQIWDFPYGEQVVGTISAVTLFLGIVLGISKASYDNELVPYDGQVVVAATSDGGRELALMSAISMEQLEGRDTIVLKVVTPESNKG